MKRFLYALIQLVYSWNAGGLVWNCHRLTLINISSCAVLPMTRHQCSIHCEGSRVSNGASKRKWAMQTICYILKGAQKPSINETKLNVKVKFKEQKILKTERSKYERDCKKKTNNNDVHLITHAKGENVTNIWSSKCLFGKVAVSIKANMSACKRANMSTWIHLSARTATFV